MFTGLLHLCVHVLLQIFLNEAFGVGQSTCECPLRNFECHHVAAALLYGYVHVSYKCISQSVFLEFSFDDAFMYLRQGCIKSLYRELIHFIVVSVLQFDNCNLMTTTIDF